jgi:hypothetical protein
MKEILTLLVQDDIKQTRLVRALGHLDIDATSQLSHASGIVFELMGMNVDLENEPFLDAYYKKIESAVADEKVNESKHVTDIINWLEIITKKE